MQTSNLKKLEIDNKVDELIGSKMDPIIKEGQALELKIQEKEGTTVKKDLVFESAGITLVTAGEKIEAKLLSKVQEAVKTKLEEIEKFTREDVEKEKAQLDLTIHKVQTETDANLAALMEDLSDVKDKIKGNLNAQRDELEDLEPFKFISENKYRELKSRYGQVFRADMGAEAFVDILSRLDIDKLATDLMAGSKNHQEQTKTQEKHNSIKSC